jgi:salicyloyl-CoA 5-hydroxylase
MRVVCIGAGPGGLYAALLLKRRRPAWHVSVLEQNGPEETFGFGVVFSEPTLDRLLKGDPQMHATLLRIGTKWDPIEVRLRDATIRCSGQGFVATGRHRLLAMLRDEARAAGVELLFHTAVDPNALPAADVIVVADGAGSTIRRRFAEHFEPTLEAGQSKFIWFGTKQSFECLTFVFEKSDDGAFGVHAYPYGEGMSTFIVETQPEALERSGLATGTAEEIEQKSLAYCERLFAKHLGGNGLVANKSRWASFRTVRNETWRKDRIVLLGDSAHTAHFSMGSGTKMALEDALALGEALGTKDDIDEALSEYEAVRRPDVRKVQQASRPSLFWWEHFQSVMPRAIEPFMFHFLTRNIRVTHNSLLRRDPAFARSVERWFEKTYGGDASTPARGLELVVRGQRLKNRIVNEGVPTPDAALGIVPIEDFDVAQATAAARASDALLGVRIDAKNIDDVDLASWESRCAWLELSVRPTPRALRVIASVRAAWSRPLSIAIDARGRPVPELVAFAVEAHRAGADVVTLGWYGKEQPRILACAEGIRFACDAVLALDPIAAGADADTLVLSGRADLLYVIRAAPPLPTMMPPPMPAPA